MRFASSSRVDDPKDPKTKEELKDLDLQLSKWQEELPLDIRHAAANSGDNDPQMVSLCLITYFVYYSSIINLREFCFILFQNT